MADFDHPVFDDARARERRFFAQLSRPRAAASEQDFYTCFKCGSKNVFSLSKQVRAGDEGTSVFNECLSCGNKWRDG